MVKKIDAVSPQDVGDGHPDNGHDMVDATPPLAIGNDARFVSPDTELKANQPSVSNMNDAAAQLMAAMDPNILQALVDAAVERRLKEQAETIAQLGFAPPQPVKDPVPAAPTFKKHYRNDVTPDIAYLELDMTAPDPRKAPIYGSWLRFNRGHFYAQTDNQVKQLEWMANRASLSAGHDEVLGGDPALYEDTGEQIFYCPFGCDPGKVHYASEKGLERHLKSVHGQGIKA